MSFAAPPHLFCENKLGIVKTDPQELHIFAFREFPIKKLNF